MTVELLYIKGCPHQEAALHLIDSVLEAERLPAALHRVLIRSQEEATSHNFPGSPTLRVNGRDIEWTHPSHISGAFACRTYFVDGRPQGVPPRSWLEHAIREAREQEQHA